MCFHPEKTVKTIRMFKLTIVQTGTVEKKLINDRSAGTIWTYAFAMPMQYSELLTLSLLKTFVLPNVTYIYKKA